MEDEMIKKIGLGVLLAGMALTASATPSSSGITCTKEHFLIWTWDSCTVTKITPRAVAAPEIDPASAVAGLTLMIGGILVMRGRRSKGATA
jgi:hypothetical protein